MEIKYYKELDGLRGIAALMVMVFHFIPNGNSLTWLYHLHKIAVFGQTGVTLFFVLSGFLITRILFAAKTGNNYFINFYAKRALRIFPLYYMALALYYFVLPLITSSTVSQHHTWMYWLYLQNLSDTFLWGATGPQHFWSLAVEEHFYLFWPLVIYFTPNKSIWRVIALIIALALICRYLLIANGYGTFYFTLSVMDGLAIGAILAWLEKEQKLKSINFNYIICGALLLMIPAWLLTGGQGLAWVQIIKFPVIALFYMGVIGLLIQKQTSLNKLLLSPALRFSGKISYGLYVFHPMCFGIYYHYVPPLPVWLNALACFALSYVTATISFYFYELHFIKLKRYFEAPNWRNKQEQQFN